MSRIGKLPIAIPAGVDVTVEGKTVTVSGSKGTVTHVAPDIISVAVEDNQVVVTRPDDERQSRSLHGLTRTLIANMITGVTEGFRKDLEINGTGYRVVPKGTDLEFSLGYSHTILFPAPEGITFQVDGANKLSVSGIDKQLVGETAARIRKLRAPEPYKGKGIRYVGEHVRRKAGKAGK